MIHLDILIRDVRDARARGKSVLLVALEDQKDFKPDWSRIEEPGSDDPVARARPVAMIYMPEAALKALEPMFAKDPRVRIFAKYKKFQRVNLSNSERRRIEYVTKHGGGR